MCQCLEQGKARNLVGLLRYRKMVLFVPIPAGDLYRHHAITVTAIVAVIASIAVTVTIAMIYIPMAFWALFTCGSLDHDTWTL